MCTFVYTAVLPEWLGTCFCRERRIKKPQDKLLKGPSLLSFVIALRCLGYFEGYYQLIHRIFLFLRCKMRVSEDLLQRLVPKYRGNHVQWNASFY